MHSGTDQYYSFRRLKIYCSISIVKHLLIDFIFFAVEPILIIGDSEQMDGSSFVTLDNNLIFVVYIFEVLGFFTDVSQHSFALFVGEGIAIGEIGLSYFWEDKIKVQFRVILFGLSSIN